MIRNRLLLSLLLLSIVHYCFPDNSVGTPQMSVDVNGNGAATFSLPIEIPNGGGFHPQIGIGYNSQTSGYGNVGYGVSITGISSITCGGKNIFFDNEVRGNDYSSNSSFYLDGKKLFIDRGDNEEEDNDYIAYTVEGEPYTKVLLHGVMSSNSVDCWFEVIASNGSTYKYGYSDNSRLTFSNNGNACCASWYISSACDKYANEINYTYTKDSLCVSPSRIVYGINSNNPRNITCAIEFAYNYIASGNRVNFKIGENTGTISRKLSSITSSINGQTYRTYTFGYEEDNDGTSKGFTRLTSITERNQNGDSYPAITIDWNTIPETSIQTYDKNLTIDFSDNFQNETDRKFFASDINGDGISDIIKLSYANGINAMLTGARLYVYDSHIGSDGNVSFSSSIMSRYDLGAQVSFGCYSIVNNDLFTFDIDGDGYSDFISQYYENIGNETFRVNYAIAFGRPNRGPHSIRTIYSPLINTNSKSPLTVVLDVDGNGKDDIFYIEEKGTSNIYNGRILSITTTRELEWHDISLVLENEPKKIFTGDFNNDGLHDIIVLFSQGYKIFYNNGFCNSYNSIFSSEHSVYYANADFKDAHIVKQGDFNGDGLLDFVCSKSDNGRLYLELNNANGTFTQEVTPDYGIYDQGGTEKDDNDFTLAVFDLNHDGLSDVVMAKSMFRYHSGSIFEHSYYKYEDGEGTTDIKWLESNGHNLILRNSFSKRNREKDASPFHILLGDFDGDGAIELANYGALLNSNSDSFTDNVFHFYKNGNDIPSLNRISSITNGLAVKTTCSYSSITNPSVYTKGIGSYPVNSYTIPLSVVSKIRVEGRGISSSETTCLYSGLRIHRSGRGLLGFDSYSRNNLTQGTVECYTINEWDTRLFIPAETVKSTTIGTNSSETRNCYFFEYSNRLSTSCCNYAIWRNQERSIDFDGYLTETTTQYITEHGHIYSLFIKYDGLQGMYKETKYYYGEKHGGEYLPESTYTCQMHSDDGDALEKYVNYTYDAAGNLTTVVENPDSLFPLTRSYTYDCYGNKTSEQIEGRDVVSIVTSYEYDPSGRFVSYSSTTPVSDATSYQYNIFGDLIQEQDVTIPDNILTTNYTYDAWGKKVRTDFPDGNYTESVTDWDNTLYNATYSVTTTSSNAPWEKYIYDAEGRELSYSSVGMKGISISKETAYTDKGQVSQIISRTGSLSTTESITYDERGRKTSDVYSTGISETYEYNGRSVTTISDGRSTTTTYDAWGNIKQIIDPISSVSYTYNANGKPSIIETDGNCVVLKYDQSGNRIEMIDPDAGITTYSYAADGTLLTQTDARGVSTSYIYDELKRVVQRTYSDSFGNSVTQNNVYGTSGYGKNRIIEQDCNGCTRRFGYDRYGRLISESRTIYHYPTGYKTYTKQCTYNALGQKIRVSYPLNSPDDDSASLDIDYAYDRYGFLDGMSLGGQQLYRVSSYDGQILETNTIVGTIKKTIDNNGYPTLYQLKDGSFVIDEQMFSFDNSRGNLASRSWTHDNSIVFDESFAYDDLDRLTEVRNYGGSTAMEMSYADNGNITSKTDVGSYSYGSSSKPHAVTEVSNDNNTINSDRIDTDYGLNGKIEFINNTSGSFRAYTYGPDDEKWKSVYCDPEQITENDIEVAYFDNYEKKIEDNVITEYYFLDNDVILINRSSAEDSDTESCWFAYQAITDYQGNILTVYDENYNEVFRAQYDAWGKQTILLNTIGLTHGYTGHEMLSSFDLINMGGRMYDPALGRFLSCDNYVQEPDNSQNFNRYSYCLNNPLKYTDPSGELFWLVPAIAGGLFNWAAHDFQVNAKGLGYFGVGVLAGAVSSGIGAGVNAAMAGGSFWAGTIGATNASATGFLAGAASGASAGFAGGFISGAGNSWVGGNSFSDGLMKGLYNIGRATISGGILGGLFGGIDAINKGCKFWNGTTQLDFNGAYSCRWSEGILSRDYIEGENTCTGKYIGEFEGQKVFCMHRNGLISKHKYNAMTVPERGIIAPSDVFRAGDEGIALLQHEFGHILQYRKYGAHAYWHVIAPESLASATLQNISRHNHDYFWTETWANYLSKYYFGKSWKGNRIPGVTYPVKNISWFNILRLILS